MPLLRNSPIAMDDSFMRFGLAALKFSRTLGGVLIFGRDSEGGGTKILRRLRGERYAFITGTFPEKYPPINSEQFRSKSGSTHQCQQ